MKIAVITPRLSNKAGGLAFSVPPIVGALQAMPNTDVLVISSDDRDRNHFNSDWGSNVFATGGSGGFFDGFSQRALNALTDFEPDVVDVQGVWAWPSIFNLHYQARRKTPYVITPRGMLDEWALQRSRRKKALALSLYERRHLNGASRIRALCLPERESVLRFMPGTAVIEIPNAIEMPTLSHINNLNPADLKTLLFLGRIDQKKGVQELIQAWAKAKGLSLTEKWRLEIVGWGDENYVASMRKLSHDLGLTGDDFKLSGPKFGSEKETAFREASAFILPSFSEGLPMAVLESWSYGLPALLTKGCNLPEGFASGAAQEILNTPEGILSGIRWLTSSTPEDLRLMGEKARKLTTQTYSVSAVSVQCRDMYKQVIEGVQ